MRPLPTSLQKLDHAGRLRSRTDETETGYRKRYAGMERTLARKRGSPVGVADVIEDLRGRAKSLADASYYVYRATILQRIRDMFAEGALDEENVEKLVARLTPEEGTASIGTCMPKKRTSAGLRKHVRAVSFSTLASMAYARSTGRTTSLEPSSSMAQTSSRDRVRLSEASFQADGSQFEQQSARMEDVSEKFETSA